MALPPIPPVGGTPATPAVPPKPPAATGETTDFGSAIRRGLEHVAGLERQVDKVTESLATGGDAQVHDLMIATSKAGVAVEMLAAIRNRAVEAYQEIMRLPV